MRCAILSAVLLFGCSSDGDGAALGATKNDAAIVATGGASSTGGVSSTGGAATGGAIATDRSHSTGGAVASTGDAATDSAIDAAVLDSATASDAATDADGADGLAYGCVALDLPSYCTLCTVQVCIVPDPDHGLVMLSDRPWNNCPAVTDWAPGATVFDACESVISSARQKCCPDRICECTFGPCCDGCHYFDACP